MLEVIENMIDCVNGRQTKYRAKLGFEFDSIDRPVRNKAVYFTTEEIRAKEIDFIIHIYSPVSLGGFECVLTACEVHNLLFENGFELKNVRIGEVEYNGDSYSFVTRIYASASDNSLEFNEVAPVVPEVFAIESESAYYGDIWFTASKVEISYGCEGYPVQTFLSDEPIDYIYEKINYKIKLGGIPKSIIERFLKYPRFNLRIQKTDDMFKNCVCEKGNIIIGEENGDAQIISVEKR